VNDLDAASIELRVSTDIIRSLKLNPETAHLETMTSEHKNAWIEGMEHIIRDLQCAVNTAKGINYDL